MENSHTSPPPPFIFQHTITGGFSISFEFFLNNFYSTDIYIIENDALVYTANCDKVDHYTYATNNMTGFAQTYGLYVHVADRRGPQYMQGYVPLTFAPFAPSPPRSGTLKTQILAILQGNAYYPTTQTALINVEVVRVGRF